MRRGDDRARAPLDLLRVDALLEALLCLRVVSEGAPDPLGADERLPLFGDGVPERDVGLAVLRGSEAALLVVADDEADLVAKTLSGQRVDELALLGVTSLDLLGQRLANLEDRDGENVASELRLLLLQQGLKLGGLSGGEISGADGDYLLRCCCRLLDGMN